MKKINEFFFGDEYNWIDLTWFYGFILIAAAFGINLLRMKGWF